MSSSRQGTPLMAYSDSPLRNRVRVIFTSLNSTGRVPEWLSIVSDTSARPRAGFPVVPAKMTSSIFPERTAVGAWAPRTHAMASTTLDLPLPLGPTTTVTPGSRSIEVVSANDLKPLSVRFFRCIGDDGSNPNYICVVRGLWKARGAVPGSPERALTPGCRSSRSTSRRT